MRSRDSECGVCACGCVCAHVSVCVAFPESESEIDGGYVCPCTRITTEGYRLC